MRPVCWCSLPSCPPIQRIGVQILETLYYNDPRGHYNTCSFQNLEDKTPVSTLAAAYFTATNLRFVANLLAGGEINRRQSRHRA
jgi:hypothetical protein